MTVPSPERPTREQVLSAYGRPVPDVIARGLDVLFCGINPGLYSGAIGHHFARPGNRFWRTLEASGFTDRVLSPYEERDLLGFGLGITNLVEGATARADELPPVALRDGATRLEAKVSRFGPRVVAMLGVTAYRVAFARPAAAVGIQPDRLGPSILWVLPNPSGLNAHYQVPDLARAFGELRSSLAAG